MALAVTGCGTTSVPLADRPEAELSRVVGSGATAAVVLRPPGAARTARVPTVVFLHGWTAISPRSYGPWLLHLLAGGRQVVFPVYQQPPFLAPGTAYGNAVAGLRDAFAVAPPDPGDVVVAGHSAGGALASDLAAGARRIGLPQPRAVLAALPGRSLRGLPALLPEVDPAAIPPDVPVVAIAGADDAVVGTRWARRIGTRAPGGRFVLVRDPDADDHLAAQRDDPAARRVFWSALDRLLGR